MMHSMSYKILRSRYELMSLMVYCHGTLSTFHFFCCLRLFFIQNPVVRAHVPRMTLDEVFEQKSDVAKIVLEELEKVELLHIFASIIYIADIVQRFGAYRQNFADTCRIY